MQKKISIVHSGTGHYVEFYMDFDEDFDNDDVYDYKQRMNMIFNEINKLNQMPIKELHDWYYSITDILNHNLKVLRELKDIDPYQVLFDDLVNTYGNK